MKVIVSPQIRCKVCLFAVMSMWLPVEVVAQETSAKSFEVKEEETQLAKRFAIRESVESPFEYSLSTGMRQDNLSWSIANGGINVTSEVSFKKTVIAQTRATAKVNLPHDWLLRAAIASGEVKAGDNRDSDYAGSNRTQEYSRSDNKTGGAVYDFSLGLGRKVRLRDLWNGMTVSVIPMAGMSLNQQSFTMYDGHQTVPANGALLSGLNNNYDTKWQGTWLGLEAILGLNEKLSLNSAVDYHWVNYSAVANWNLRNDLVHPASFQHFAKGRGTVVSVSAVYRYSRNLKLNISLEQQKWSTGAGYDQTNFAYGATSYYTLNQVSWDSRAFMLGVSYQF